MKEKTTQAAECLSRLTAELDRLTRGNYYEYART
jgi:hypothetical protein